VPNSVWGISIKGQAAKLLAHDVTQKTADFHRARKTVDGNSNSVIPKKRTRNPSYLLHAHLGYNNSDGRKQETPIHGSSSAMIDSSEDVSRVVENESEKNRYGLLLLL
jgi:hypothetical protein